MIRSEERESTNREKGENKHGEKSTHVSQHYIFLLHLSIIGLSFSSFLLVVSLLLLLLHFIQLIVLDIIVHNCIYYVSKHFCFSTLHHQPLQIFFIPLPYSSCVFRVLHNVFFPKKKYFLLKKKKNVLPT